MLSLVFAAVVGLTGDEIVKKMLEVDMYGFNDGEVAARAVLKDKSGKTSQLAFTVLAYRYDPPNSKSIVRFSAPPDLAGAGFLQIQKKDGDDDRFLFLPDLRKSRRIAGNLRSNAFMGTDFSYADIDNRELRESSAALKGEEQLGGAPCYYVEVIPKGADAVYSRIELWIRKDNFISARSKVYDKANAHVKTTELKAMSKTGTRVFASRTEVTNHKESHTTELLIDKIVARKQVPDSEFTVRNLEKL